MFNAYLIRPGVTTEIWNESVRSVSFTPDTLNKLAIISKTYGVSRSAAIRILVEAFVDNKTSKLEIEMEKAVE